MLSPSRHAASPGRLFAENRSRMNRSLFFVVLGAGFIGGLVVGYAMMGTAHAVLEVGSEQHDVEHVDAAGGEGTDPRMTAPRPDQTSSASGTTTPQKAGPKLPTQGDTIHTVCTSNGSPYLNFQNRIMYATFKMVQQMPGGEKMVAFTRILHRSSCDAACSEIPTFQVQPLHPRCDEWCEFPVADRPNAVQQWIKAVELDPTMLQAPWVLMIETDYVFMKPLQAPRAESSTPSWGFPFGYIVPTFQGIEDAMRKLYPEDKGPLSDIPPSGPAPVLLRFGELQRIAPDWERLTKLIEDSPMMVEKLGWVREMYAWSAAVALQKVQLQLPAPPQSPLIAQPPADTALGSAAMFHYTWGTIYRVDGKDIWAFDKRFHTKREEALEVPKQPLPPPFDKDRGVVLQDGHRVTKELNDVMAQMITQINRAVETLPVLSE